MKYEEYTNEWDKDRSAAEIQGDLRAIRSEMSETLRELEDRMSPRAAMGRAAERAKRGPVRKAREIAQQGRERPLWAALFGVGLILGTLLGWWAWSRRRSGDRPRDKMLIL